MSTNFEFLNGDILTAAPNSIQIKIFLFLPIKPSLKKYFSRKHYKLIFYIGNLIVDWIEFNIQEFIGKNKMQNNYF